MRLTSLSAVGRRAAFLLILALLALAGSSPLLAQGGEAELRLPDLGQAVFLNGVSGPTLLTIGLGVAVLGLVFGLVMYTHLRNLPVHCLDARNFRADLRDLQNLPGHAGQVPADPGVFIGVIIVFYFGVPASDGGVQGR